MTMPTQPRSSPYLHVPTTMVTTSVPNSTSTYQYIGQSGVIPPPQQPQVQLSQEMACVQKQIQHLQNQLHNMNNKGGIEFIF